MDGPGGDANGAGPQCELGEGGGHAAALHEHGARAEGDRDQPGQGEEEQEHHGQVWNTINSFSTLMGNGRLADWSGLVRRRSMKDKPKTKPQEVQKPNQECSTIVIGTKDGAKGRGDTYEHLVGEWGVKVKVMQIKRKFEQD